jgi:hypothetical protein
VAMLLENMLSFISFVYCALQIEDKTLNNNPHVYSHILLFFLDVCKTQASLELSRGIN